MVQARPLAVGDGEVVHIALAVHPGGCDAPVRPILLAIFGEAESEPCVEVDGILNFGGEDVEMIEPLRMAAFIEIVATQQMRALLHRRIKLDRETAGIGKLQCSALERLLDKLMRDRVFGKNAAALSRSPSLPTLNPSRRQAAFSALRNTTE